MEDNGSDSSALAVIQQIPPTETAVAQWRRTTDIAGLVRAVVLNCTVTIQGRKYLTVAGFQAIANAFGCVASARDVVRVEGGWQAVGEVKRMSDGMVLATGIGLLGDDEKVWQSRPQFSKMAMAQTRACGRALRAAFAFMAPVIDGNLQTTPAEELEAVQGSTEPPAPVASLKDRLRNPPPSPPNGAKRTHAEIVMGNFGNHPGERLSVLSDDDVVFYRRACKRTLADASKQRFHDNEKIRLESFDAELRFRGLPVEG